MSKRSSHSDFPIGKLTKVKSVLPSPEKLVLPIDWGFPDKRLMAKLRAGHRAAKNLKGKFVG